LTPPDCEPAGLWGEPESSVAVRIREPSEIMGWKAEPGAKGMHAELRQAYDREMQAATESYDDGNLDHSLTSNVHISSVNHSPFPMQEHTGGC